MAGKIKVGDKGAYMGDVAKKGIGTVVAIDRKVAVVKFEGWKTNASFVLADLTKVDR